MSGPYTGIGWYSSGGHYNNHMPPPTRNPASFDNGTEAPGDMPAKPLFDPQHPEVIILDFTSAVPQSGAPQRPLEPLEKTAAVLPSKAIGIKPKD